jgi:sulfide:quinone oxidoreductase
VSALPAPGAGISTELRPRVVILGAGVAALEFALGLAELAPGRADVELIAPDDWFVYRPIAVAETFTHGTPFRLPLARIAADAAVRRIRTRVVSVDPGGAAVFTTTGEAFPYDLLFVAAGARAEEALPGALTFRGPRDEDDFRALLAELEARQVASVAFVVPPGASWSLPLYELALMTAARLRQREVSEVKLSLVTPESRPLARFGELASDAVAQLLADASVETHYECEGAEVVGQTLCVMPRGLLPAERVVTVPRLRGPHVAGLPCDDDGFLPTDAHGLVHGMRDVYAAGDAAAFPVKHGGLAVEQAAAAAEAVAARLGVALEPAPFEPVLRGLLLTGGAPRFLWSAPAGRRPEPPAVATHPLWWPPGKIAGGRLAAYLHAQGLPVPPPPAGPASAPSEADCDMHETTAT